MTKPEFGDWAHRSPAEKHRQRRQRHLDRARRERGLRAKRQQGADDE